MFEGNPTDCAKCYSRNVSESDGMYGIELIISLLYNKVLILNVSIIVGVVVNIVIVTVVVDIPFELDQSVFALSYKNFPTSSLTESG